MKGVTVAVLVLVLAAALVFWKVMLAPDGTSPASSAATSDQLDPGETVDHLVQGSQEESSPGLEVSMPILDGLQADSRLTLYLPHEERELDGRVDSVNFTTAGNQVVRGHVTDPDTGQVYPFVFTSGRQLTFGTIQTSRNRYQMEVRESGGRIVAANELKKDIDYSQPDYVMPDRMVVAEKPE